MDKGPDAFRTISEVAEDLDLPQHVLRFWETRFPQIRPLKRGGGRRYYRPDDIDLLRGIRHLLYGEGYTIRGVQRILKDEGLKFVQAAWRNAAEDAAAASRARAIAQSELNGSDGDADHPAPDPGGRGGLLGLLPKLSGREAEAPPLPRTVDLPRPARGDQSPARGRGEGEPTFPFRPADAAAARAPAERQQSDRQPSELKNQPPRLRLKSLDPVGDEQPVPDELRSAQAYAPPAVRQAAVDAGHPGAPLRQRLSREDVRRLQATLYELQECRRILDQALGVPRSGR